MWGRLAAWLLVAAALPSCFDATSELRGQPCTGDASCGELSCSYGYCGGPPRCTAGASVGDYCFTLTDATFPTAGAAEAMAIGRVDLDPFADVVTVAEDGRISVLINDGMMGLAAAIESAPLADGPTGIGIGDVDGVGWHEPVVSTGDGRVVVAPVSDIGFAAPVVAASGLQRPVVPTVGNFYADLQGGVPDVAVLVGDGMDVLPQAGALAFDMPVHTQIDEPSDLATLSDDGALALVARASQHDIQVLERALDGRYTPVSTIEVGGAPARFVHGDLDGDDYGDILVASTEGELWLITSKTAAPQSPEDWSKPQLVYDLGWVPEVLALGELDDDGDLEMIIGGMTPSGRSDVFLFDNDGDGVPVYGGSLGVVDGTAVAAGELDGDGVPEIVVATASPADVRVARRTVAPPPPGDPTTSGSGDVPSTEEETRGSDPSDPTEDPTEDPSGTEGPLDTGEPGCFGYMIDFQCVELTSQVGEHGLAKVTAMLHLRSVNVVQIYGGYDDAGLGGGIAQLNVLPEMGAYELEVIGPLDGLGVPTGADAGLILTGTNRDLAITTENSVFIYTDGFTPLFDATGLNPREPVITDVDADAYGDVIMVTDQGLGLLRGSTIASSAKAEPVTAIELSPVDPLLSDLEWIPQLGPTPLLVIGARPEGDAAAGVAWNGMAFDVVANLPGDHASYTALGALEGVGNFGYLLAASGAKNNQQIELTLQTGLNEWMELAPFGSSTGLIHDLVTFDMNADGNSDLLAMYDGEFGTEIHVLLWRGDGFEHVATLVDVPAATHMLPVRRDDGWDLLVIDPSAVYAYSQVFHG